MIEIFILFLENFLLRKYRWRKNVTYFWHVKDTLHVIYFWHVTYFLHRCEICFITKIFFDVQWFSYRKKFEKSWAVFPTFPETCMAGGQRGVSGVFGWLRNFSIIAIFWVFDVWVLFDIYVAVDKFFCVWVCGELLEKRLIILMFLRNSYWIICRRIKNFDRNFCPVFGLENFWQYRWKILRWKKFLV